MHEHFDADGNRTGHTVITRESAWDDESRGRAMRLDEYERGMCRCGCGLPRRVAHDPEQTFKVERVKCQASRALAQVRRQDLAAAQDQRRDEGWSDGLSYYAIPIEAEEV